MDMGGIKSKAEEEEYMLMMKRNLDEQKRKRERDAVKRQIAEKQMSKLVSILNKLSWYV